MKTYRIRGIINAPKQKERVCHEDLHQGTLCAAPLFNRADLLRTTRGAQGGYMLARLPHQYTVGEVLRLTEGSLSPVDCVDQDPVVCGRSVDCATLPIWRGLSKVINEYLDGITLQDILDQQRERYANDYVI